MNKLTTKMVIHPSTGKVATMFTWQTIRGFGGLLTTNTYFCDICEEPKIRPTRELHYNDGMGKGTINICEECRKKFCMEK